MIDRRTAYDGRERSSIGARCGYLVARTRRRFESPSPFRGTTRPSFRLFGTYVIPAKAGIRGHRAYESAILSDRSKSSSFRASTRTSFRRKPESSVIGNIPQRPIRTVRRHTIARRRPRTLAQAKTRGSGGISTPLTVAAMTRLFARTRRRRPDGPRVAQPAPPKRRRLAPLEIRFALFDERLHALLLIFRGE